MADLIASTEAALQDHAPADADAVRNAPPLVCFSAGLQAEVTVLQRFLFSALYRHPQVMQTTALARQALAELFDAYRADPSAMPADFAQAADTPRAVADYIAGMTDRYALREHHRLTGRRVFAD
jgi:dGTPase